MSKHVTDLQDNNRKVFYDPTTNRFFGVIRIFPRSALTTGLHGYYSTAKTGDTSRYTVTKSFLKTCHQIDDPQCDLTEIEQGSNEFIIKGYDPLHDVRRKNPHMRLNDKQSTIAQYRWDKKNDFWAFERELSASMAEDWPDDDDYTYPEDNE